MTSMLKGGVSGPHGGPASAPTAKTDAANAATPSVTDGSERMPFSPPRGRLPTRASIAAIAAAIGHLTYFRAAALRGAAECGAYRARAAPHPELVVDVLEVRSDSRRRDEEPAADLAVRQALGNEGEHVELALGQVREVRPALPPRAQAGKVWAEEREERTIAFVEVRAGPALELEEARVARRRRQPQLQLVLAAERPHHRYIERALAETRSRDDVADPQRLDRGGVVDVAQRVRAAGRRERLVEPQRFVVAARDANRVAVAETPL